MNVKLKMYGFTKDNLYKRSKRIPKKVIKVFNQTLMSPKYSFPEYLMKENVTVFITKEIADTLPDELFVKNTYDDGRYIFANEKDVWDNTKSLLFTLGPGYDDLDVPHLLYEEELKN